MREIKFRGQTGTTEDNKWVFGHYYRVKSFFNDNEGHYISTIRSDHLQDYNIDENTLGQYTGLHDKNGKEIYEGDIAKVEKIDLAQIIWDKDRMAWGIKPINDFYFDSPLLADNTDLGLEVIGNLYDNPELLERSSNGD